MLIYFEVGGFLSFNESQILYFTPSPGARLAKTKYEKNFIMPNSKKVPRVMKSAVLFGDNASGKTNWFYALASFKRIIKNGLERDFDRDFNFGSEKMKFSIGIVKPGSNCVFEYALEFNKDKQIIYEEFICNDDVIFKYEEKKLSINIELDKKNEIESLFNTVKSTDTFLSKLEDFIPDYIKSFVDAILSVGVVTESPFNEEIKYLPQFRLIDENDKKIIDDYKEEVIEILSDLDSTIDDFGYTKRETKDKAGYDLVIKRNGQEYDISYESQGIRKIVNLLINILAIFDGKTVLIDELDSSIGAKALIRIFNSIINSNKNRNGQLIISSHNLILMDFDSFHPSQLYVFSKDNKYQSVIRSIDDFELRYEKKEPAFFIFRWIF